jgi:hypothetical protein
LSQGGDVPVTTKPVILQKHNIINLLWDLEPEKLTLFILNHTAWLNPLGEDGYKLEFRGSLRVVVIVVPQAEEVAGAAVIEGGSKTFIIAVEPKKQTRSAGHREGISMLQILAGLEAILVM